MKKIICLLLIFSFILISFSGCKVDKKPNENPEINSETNENQNINPSDAPVKTIGVVGVKVLTDIKPETTSCEIELTYSKEEEVLWKKIVSDISVANARFNFSLLKITEDKIFTNTNSSIHCLSTVDGSELWRTELLQNTVENICNTNKFLFAVYKDEQTEAKVDVFNIKNGDFISSIIFDDIDYFSSPTTINVAGENVVIKDSNGNVRYLNPEKLIVVQEIDYKYREVVVAEKLILKQSNEASYPKAYFYSYENYEIYFTISRVFEEPEETSEINYEEQNISTVNFLGEKTIAYVLPDNPNVKCTYLYKDGLLYSLAVLTPEVYDPLIFYSITSSFSFK